MGAPWTALAMRGIAVFSVNANYASRYKEAPYSGRGCHGNQMQLENGKVKLTEIEQGLMKATLGERQEDIGPGELKAKLEEWLANHDNVPVIGLMVRDLLAKVSRLTLH